MTKYYTLISLNILLIIFLYTCVLCCRIRDMDPRNYELIYCVIFEYTVTACYMCFDIYYSLIIDSIDDQSLSNHLNQSSNINPNGIIFKLFHARKVFGSIFFFYPVTRQNREATIDHSIQVHRLLLNTGNSHMVGLKPIK